MSERKKYSEEIQEIITAPPKWITRWGVTLAIGLLLIITGFSFIITYPDSTRVPMTILPEKQVLVQAIENGVIEKISVSDNQFVHKGDTLFTISSHYVISPITGTVRFIGFPQKDVAIGKDQPLLTIRDISADAWYGEIRGVRGLEINQDLTLLLSSGTASGKVSSIRRSPDSTMIVKVTFDKLPSNILLNEDTHAEAEITSTRRSVFARLTESLARRATIVE